MNFSRTRHGVLVGVLALALAACSTATPEAADSDGAEASVQFEDNNGSQTVATPFTSVVATDNRTFETLASWGIELSAAAVALMPSTISYTQDDSIIDLGNHGEPDLEAVVA
ncbi:MAG: iron ABC transporter substrate-binding protein, partial [Salinibacterium amurskyense]